MPNTPNYNLPLFEGTDIVNMLTYYNSAMNEIDTEMMTNATGIADNGTTIQQHTASINKINDEIETIDNQLTTANLPQMKLDINSLKGEITGVATTVTATINTALISNRCVLSTFNNIYSLYVDASYGAASPSVNLSTYTNATTPQCGHRNVNFPANNYELLRIVGDNIFSLGINEAQWLPSIMISKTTGLEYTSIIAAYNGADTILYVGEGSNPTTVNVSARGQLTLAKTL